MSTKYLYACSNCHVVRCDPKTQYNSGRLQMWCPVCERWVDAEPVESSQIA
jgi:lipopolysaccharide biosynthesis regulator YciM